MQTVRDACQLQPNALSIKLSDQIEQLDELITAEGDGAELGRQERHITPVDLAANEIYDILRKRLFTCLPDQAEIGDIAATYPFHPRLKNVIALFKENEQFKQTRGLIELVSRLLRSVWERQANDVFLIGLQHFASGHDLKYFAEKLGIDLHTGDVEQ